MVEIMDSDGTHFVAESCSEIWGNPTWQRHIAKLRPDVTSKGPVGVVSLKNDNEVVWRKIFLEAKYERINSSQSHVLSSGPQRNYI